MAQKLKTPQKKLPPPPLWRQVNLHQLLNLVRAYYSGSLKKSDHNSRAQLQADKAIPMPHVEPQGKSLMADVTFDQMDDVIRHLRRIRVQVGGMGVNGWHEYVIGVHLGIFKPYLKQFEMMPKVTAEHKSESFDVLGRAFQRIVLNKESDN